MAVYEEQDGRRQQHNGGDGTSASSVGTSSPDIFQAVPSKTADASNQLLMGLFDYRIRIRIHNESEPKVNPTHIRHA